MKRCSKPLVWIVALLAVATLISGLAVFAPVPLADRQGLERVELGGPFLPFVFQDQKSLGVDCLGCPPLPVRTSLLSPWEFPTWVAWERWAINVMLVAIISGGIAFLAVASFQRWRARHQTPSAVATQQRQDDR